MKQTAAVVSVVGVFLIGILVGGLAMHLYHAEKMMRPVVGPDPVRERVMGARIGERLGRILDLSADQRQEIEAIRRESRMQAEEMRREMAPQVREVMESARTRIMEVLTPEQQDRLQQLGLRERRLVERYLLGERGRPGRPGPPRERRQ